MDITVTHVSGDRFAIQVRGHRLEVDQPLADGGQDTGPTPTELFVASLAACVAFYGRRFLARHDLEAAGLRVDCRATMSTDRPARVASVTLDIAGVPELADNRRKALLAVVDHCTVHNSLRTPPEVRVTLAEPAGTDTRPMLATLDG
jgi:putative redox protein